MSYKTISNTHPRLAGQSQIADFYELVSQHQHLTLQQLESAQEKALMSSERIAIILDADGEYVDDGDGDVAWEGLWDGMRNQLRNDFTHQLRMIKVYQYLINRK